MTSTGCHRTLSGTVPLEDMTPTGRPAWGDISVPPPPASTRKGTDHEQRRAAPTQQHSLMDSDRPPFEFDCPNCGRPIENADTADSGVHPECEAEYGTHVEAVEAAVPRRWIGD